MRNISRRSLLRAFRGFWSPTGLCAQCRGLCLGGTGRIWAGRLTCLDAVLLGRFEPEGEVMLAGHPRLLLFEFDLLPVLVGGPFAQNLRCIIWDLGSTTRSVCILDLTATSLGGRGALGSGSFPDRGSVVRSAGLTPHPLPTLPWAFRAKCRAPLPTLPERRRAAGFGGFPCCFLTSIPLEFPPRSGGLWCGLFSPDHQEKHSV